MSLRQSLRGCCPIAEDRRRGALSATVAAKTSRRSGRRRSERRNGHRGYIPRLPDWRTRFSFRDTRASYNNSQKDNRLTISARSQSQRLLARRSPACRTQRARFRLCHGCRSRRSAAGLDEILAQVDAQLLEMRVLQLDLAVCALLALWFVDVGSRSGARLGDGRCGPHAAWSESGRR